MWTEGSPGSLPYLGLSPGRMFRSHDSIYHAQASTLCPAPCGLIACPEFLIDSVGADKIISNHRRDSRHITCHLSNTHLPSTTSQYHFLISMPLLVNLLREKLHINRCKTKIQHIHPLWRYFLKDIAITFLKNNELIKKIAETWNSILRCLNQSTSLSSTIHSACAAWTGNLSAQIR